MNIERVPDRDTEVHEDGIAFVVDEDIDYGALREQAVAKGLSATVVGEPRDDEPGGALWIIGTDEETARKLIEEYEPPQKDPVSKSTPPAEPRALTSDDDTEPGFLPPPEAQPELSDDDKSFVQNVLNSEGGITDQDRDRALRIMLRHFFWESVS